MRDIEITTECLEFIDYQEERVIMKKSVNAKELIEKRYGKRGSDSREKFREEAFSFYFGEIIRSRRKELKMSQNDLAELVGKKRPYISRVENGEDIRISNLALIANALNLSLQLTAG